MERRRGKSLAVSAFQAFSQAGVVERGDMDTLFWQAVASLKAKGSISLPDCFCVCLAQRLGAIVVTADRNEFTPLDKQGIAPIQFIR